MKEPIILPEEITNALADQETYAKLQNTGKRVAARKGHQNTASISFDLQMLRTLLKLNPNVKIKDLTTPIPPPKRK